MKDYYIIKSFCKKLMLTGSGNFWFDENDKTIGDDTTIKYKTYQFVLLSTYTVMVLLQDLANLGDYPEEEKRNCAPYSVTLSIAWLKIMSVIWNKKLIKGLNKRMIAACERLEDPSLMVNKYKVMKVNIIIDFVAVYGAVAFSVFEGVRGMFHDSHFVVVVTYYPAYEDDSVPATIMRVIMATTVCLKVTTMIMSDLFTVIYLIMLKYKFITLGRYFVKLNDDFHQLNDSGNKLMARDKLCTGLVEGIIMHKEVLGLCADVFKAFGTVMTCQLVLTSWAVVSFLLQLAMTDELNVVAAIKGVFFVTAMYCFLAMIVCNAGEITHQASLLPDVIFHCGWYSCPPRHGQKHNIRKMIQIAVARAQQPVVMKSFNMIELSYSTFLSVVRLTYSVFTLICAQK